MLIHTSTQPPTVHMILNNFQSNIAVSLINTADVLDSSHSFSKIENAMNIITIQEERKLHEHSLEVSYL
jgi:hypothetical protein